MEAQVEEDEVTPWFLDHAMVNAFRDEILIGMRDEIGVVTEYRIPLPVAQKILKELTKAVASVEEYRSRQPPWENP